MSEIIILPVLARHFKGVDFCHPCAIDNAAGEFFNVTGFVEGLWRVTINKKEFQHKYYGSDHFQRDKALASAAGYDDTIIFNLELKEVV